MEQHTSLRDIDFAYQIHHFLNLFWRWKWYILLAIPLSAALAIFSVMYFGLTKKPPLTATVLIGLDNRAAENTWGNITDMYQNKERMLLNRAFLEKAVQRLSLQLSITEYSRYDIFDSVFVDTSAPYGTFHFEIDDINSDLFRIRYSNSQMNIKDKIVELGALSTLKSLNISGVFLSFSKSFLISPHQFTFSVLPMRHTIDNLLGRFKVTSPNPREQTYYFTATLEGTDYPLVSQTVNTIADLFVENNLALRRRRMKETLFILEKQLNAAENQLTQSKNELKQFLSANPAVGLSQSTQLAMNELINLETRSMEANNLIDQSNDLKSRLNSSTDDDIVRVISEVITLLQSHGSLSASSLQLSLNQYQQDKSKAVGNYDKSHPIFKEINSKLLSLKSRTDEALNSFTIQLRKSMTDKDLSISKITSRMQGLPSKELQLAELQRRQEIDSEIFTSLLAKFNEAKVAETVQSADVFIMDYAVQPIPPSPRKQLTNVALIVMSCMLLLTFGPAVFFDLLDKTARTEQVLIKLLPYRFLVTLPRIKVFNSDNQNQSNKNDQSKIKSGKCNQKSGILISNNINNIYPSYTLELFRSLNTKIQLDLYDEPNKSIAISSLNMSEGKSTVAANLAISIAEHGIKTILIDCDLRKGVCNHLFNLPKSPGLTDYLSSVVDKKQSSTPTVIPLQRSSFPNLWVITSGPPADNPQKLISSTAMLLLKKRLQQQPFFLVFDSPPIGLATDAAILSNLVSRYIIVVKAGNTNTADLRKVIQKDFPIIENKILGVILNMGETANQVKYYKY